MVTQCGSHGSGDDYCHLEVVVPAVMTNCHLETIVAAVMTICLPETLLSDNLLLLHRVEAAAGHQCS